MNYLEKFLPVTADIFESFQKPMPLKNELIWNNTCQHLSDKAKAIIKKDVAMAFCKKKGQLYQETQAFGVGLRIRFLQVRDRAQFPRIEATDKFSPQ